MRATITKLPRLAIGVIPATNGPQSALQTPPSGLSPAHFTSKPCLPAEAPSSANPLRVVCLYDFEATDHSQLSFKQSEVLDVVRQDESGWWAAFRHDDGAEGWIPSTYVVPVLGGRSDLRPGKAWDSPVTSPKPSERTYRGGISPVDGIPFADRDGAKVLQYSSPTHARFSCGASPSMDSSSISQTCHTAPTIPNPLLSSRSPSPLVSTRKPTLQPSVGNGPRSSPAHPAIVSGAPKSSSSRSPVAILFGRRSRRHLVLPESCSSPSQPSIVAEPAHNGNVGPTLRSPVSCLSPDSYHLNRGRSYGAEKVKQITGDDAAQALYNTRAAHDAFLWYLQPDHGEGEIALEADGTVSAGTLPALVERLTMDHLSLAQEKQYHHTFLVTYRTFSSADEVFDLLIKRYYMKPPSALSLEETDVWMRKKCHPAQRRIFSFFTTWLERYKLVEYEPSVAQKLQGFLLLVHSPAGNNVAAKQVMKTLERLTFSVPPHPDENFQPVRKKHKKKTSSHDLSKLDPSSFSEHLCLYEQRLYRALDSRDCFDYANKHPRAPAQRLIRFCETRDRLADWVKSSVLSIDNVGKRAWMIDFWIKVAERLRSINAFSSLNAVAVALTGSMLASLRLTWAHVTRAAHLEPLVKLSNHENGFSTYRTLQRETIGPCVPFIGMYLTDFVHASEHYPDNTRAASRSGATMVNFTKRLRLSEAVDSILQHQTEGYAFAQSENPTLVTLIETTLSGTKSLDQTLLWKRSQKIQNDELGQTEIRKGLQAAGF